ncbi:MAG: flagellar hook-length control protein FliK [Phycisphaerales bacterium]|nr:flagellar hook-length control protein FliK [Phycisphaerales bacterium]
MGSAAQSRPAIGAQGEQEPPSGAAAMVSRGLGAVLSQRGGSLTMTLQPESLGAVRIEMSLERGVVAVSLRASTEQAQGLLEQNLGWLRSGLESKGLSVEKLTVQVAPPVLPSGGQPGGAPGDGQAWREESRGGQHDAGGGRSRGSFDGREGRGGGGDGAWADDAEASGGTFAGSFRLRLDAVG